jgi:hypothetical protein
MLIRPNIPAIGAAGTFIRMRKRSAAVPAYSGTANDGDTRLPGFDNIKGKSDIRP